MLDVLRGDGPLRDSGVLRLDPETRPPASAATSVAPQVLAAL